MKKVFYLRLASAMSALALLGLAGCAGSAGAEGNNRTAALLSEAVEPPQAGGHVTIGPRTYHAESHDFERPWPFGPESDQ